MSAFRSAERRELRARVRDAAQRSARTGRAIPAWLVRSEAPAEPLALFTAARGGERFLWEERRGGAVFAAAGAEMSIESTGPGRLQAAARSANALLEDAGLQPASAFDGPLLVGGFGFSSRTASAIWRGFPSLRFVLPSHLLSQSEAGMRHVVTVRVTAGADPDELARRAEQSWLALCSKLESAASPEPRDARASFRADSDQPHARYCASVRRALDAIHAGQLEKVVVARSATLSRPGGFDASRVLQTFRAAHPDCFRFAVGDGEATFLAATPERLLRLAAGRVETSALAGSAPRGRTPEADARLGAALRESKKEQEEHAVVVRALRTALEAHCAQVRALEAPELLRLDGIQHLHTPIEARLRPEEPLSLLELAALLHPSPAVAGAPRDAALSWLRANEGLDRGWYAGAVGWLSGGGEGELAVALRTALLRGDDAILHAGAGIVAGSTPEAELAETRLKLRANLTALLEI